MSRRTGAGGETKIGQKSVTYYLNGPWVQRITQFFWRPKERDIMLATFLVNFRKDDFCDFFFEREREIFFPQTIMILPLTSNLSILHLVIFELSSWNLRHTCHFLGSILKKTKMFLCWSFLILVLKDYQINLVAIINNIPCIVQKAAIKRICKCPP
jgi:hypothetical protein